MGTITKVLYLHHYTKFQTICEVKYIGKGT